MANPPPKFYSIARGFWTQLAEYGQMREKLIVAPLTLTKVRVPGNGRTDTFLACPHGCRTPSTAYTAMPLICACREATIRKIDRTSRRKPGFRRLLEATDLPDHLICCRGLIPNDARRAPLHYFTLTTSFCLTFRARNSFVRRNMPGESARADQPNKCASI